MGTWWRAYRRAGRDGLVTREGRPGPAELITSEDRGTLFAAMADYTPEELLIGGPLWTRPAVVELIRLVVGVDMTEQGVGLWLRRHGFTLWGARTLQRDAELRRLCPSADRAGS